MKKIIVIMLCLNFFVAPVFAWTITPELQKELNQRLKDVGERPYYAEPHFELAVTYAYTNKIQEE